MRNATLRSGRRITNFSLYFGPPSKWETSFPF